MKRDLLVGVAQWLSTPGEPKQNLSVALGMIERAAARGVELLVLPELWSCGYDPETLAEDARRDAEPRDGARATCLAETARRHGLFLAGSVPELGEDGVRATTRHWCFDPHGSLAAWHRKAHLYRPTREHMVFDAGPQPHDVRRPGARASRLRRRLRRRLSRGGAVAGAARRPPGAGALGL